MFGLIRKIIMGLLITIVDESNHAKWVLLSSQKYITQSIPINLHPNEYSQESHCYAFPVTLCEYVFIIGYVFQIRQKI